MELVRTARVESGSDALPVVQDRVCLNEAVYVLAVRGPSEESLAGASVEPETKAWGNTAADNYLRRICEIEDPSDELLDLYNRETWPPRFCLPHDPVRVIGGSGNRGWELFEVTAPVCYKFTVLGENARARIYRLRIAVHWGDR